MIRPASDPASITACADAIRAGSLVGLPTETVYGLGADASSDAAVAQIFAAKSPSIMALGRQSFMRANDLDYRRNVENQIETLCNVFSTPDGREGLLAFVEKRAPHWGGEK